MGRGGKVDFDGAVVVRVACQDVFVAIAAGNPEQIDHVGLFGRQADLEKQPTVGGRDARIGAVA